MNQIKIGKFIQLLRKDKNLTQVELANRIGVSDRVISKWENGRGLPNYEYISDLCDELGITFNDFIAGEKIESKDTEIKLEENLATVYKESTKNEKNIQDKNYISNYSYSCIGTNINVYHRCSSNEK